MPVWGVWMDGVLYFSTADNSRKARNLAADSRCTATTEYAGEAVIVEGTAEIVTDAGVLTRFKEAYDPKYDWDMDVSTGPMDLRPDIIGLQEVDLRIDQGNWLCRRLNDLVWDSAVDEPEYTIHHMANPRENVALEALAIMTRLPFWPTKGSIISSATASPTGSASRRAVCRLTATTLTFTTYRTLKDTRCGSLSPKSCWSGSTGTAGNRQRC